MGPNKHALDNYVRYTQHMSKYSLSFMSPHVDLWDQQYRVRQLWLLKSICLILEHICWISLWVAINTHVLFGLTQVWWTSEIVTRGWTLIWMYIYIWIYIYRERERYIYIYTRFAYVAFRRQVKSSKGKFKAVLWLRRKIRKATHVF